MKSARFLLLACVIIWGWTFVAIKIALTELHPVEMIGLRFAIGMPFLLLVLRWKQIPIRFAGHEFRPIALGSAVIAFHFLIQAVALQYTSATKTGWIIAVTPLALAVLSVVFLREHLGRRESWGIALATLGVIVLVSNGRPDRLQWLHSTGDWIVLVSAFTWATYTIVSRDLSRNHHPLAVTLAMFTPVTVGLFFAAVIFYHPAKIFSLSPHALWAMLFLAVPGILAQWIWQEGIAALGAAKAGIFLYLEPVATTLLAVPLLGEPISAFIVTGGLLVLSGVWLAEHRETELAAETAPLPE